MIHKNIFFLGLLLLVPTIINASTVKEKPIETCDIVLGAMEVTNLAALGATAGLIIKNDLYPSLINTPIQLTAPLLFVRNNSISLFTTYTIAAAVENRFHNDRPRRALDIATGINSFGWGGYILREFGSNHSTLVKGLGILTTGLLWTSGIYSMATPEQKIQFYNWLESKNNITKNNHK
jgi:hypothetical protein